MRGLPIWIEEIASFIITDLIKKGGGSEISLPPPFFLGFCMFKF